MSITNGLLTIDIHIRTKYVMKYVTTTCYNQQARLTRAAMFVRCILLMSVDPDVRVG
jgi:hypothetical protein